MGQLATPADTCYARLVSAKAPFDPPRSSGFFGSEAVQFIRTQVSTNMSNICKPISCVTWGVLATILAGGLLTAGCSRSPGGGAASPVVEKPKPEESFDLIVDTVKRRIQDTPSGFVVKQSDGGSSRLMASNTVTSEIFPPAKEGDPYRGEITIASESRYSLQRPTEEPDESNKKRDAERKDHKSGSDSLNNPGGAGSGVDILEPGLVASPGNGNQGTRVSADSGPIRAKDSVKKVFKLEYKDGRWKLLTPPDPQFERAIELAFQEALESQI
jgi:hypothetical protein